MLQRSMVYENVPKCEGTGRCRVAAVVKQQAANAGGLVEGFRSALQYKRTATQKFGLTMREAELLIRRWQVRGRARVVVKLSFS